MILRLKIGMEKLLIQNYEAKILVVNFFYINLDVIFKLKTMKKIVLLAMLIIAGLTTSNAQEAKKTTKKSTTKIEAPKVAGAGLVVENEVIDYGTIAKNSDGKREFLFMNNGSKPLIITNAQGSCGCTVPTWPKEPIAPGGKGSIGVKYSTDRVGPFTKTVTLTTNAEGQPTKILTIKGNVLADEAPKG